jgi:hypothetical protein
MSDAKRALPTALSGTSIRVKLFPATLYSVIELPSKVDFKFSETINTQEQRPRISASGIYLLFLVFIIVDSRHGNIFGVIAIPANPGNVPIPIHLSVLGDSHHIAADFNDVSVRISEVHGVIFTKRSLVSFRVIEAVKQRSIYEFHPLRAQEFLPGIECFLILHLKRKMHDPVFIIILGVHHGRIA